LPSPAPALFLNPADENLRKHYFDYRFNLFNDWFLISSIIPSLALSRGKGITMKAGSIDVAGKRLRIDCRGGSAGRATGLARRQSMLPLRYGLPTCHRL